MDRQATRRRSELLWLAHLVSGRRSAPRHVVEWYDHQIRSYQQRLEVEDLDRVSLTREIQSAGRSAEAWAGGVYERFRAMGMPLWALYAAGCRRSSGPRPPRPLP